MKKRAPATTHKKAAVFLFDQTTMQGYLNPQDLGKTDTIELLTRTGENKNIRLEEIKSIHFVREFAENSEPERKSFFSRPKLDGLWVRLKFRDGDTIEGILSNNLLDLLENGVRITPPNLHGNSLWIYTPRAALAEIKVLGVVGVARRQRVPGASNAQPKLFNE